jgi:hypothetical protein
MPQRLAIPTVNPNRKGIEENPEDFSSAPSGPKPSHMYGPGKISAAGFT